MRFHQSLGGDAQEHLVARGLEKAGAAFGLGSVPGDDPEWSQYAGMLAIPYWNPKGECVTIRFRATRQDAKPKYLQPAGSDITIYNLKALKSPSNTIVVTEGEFDCMTLSLMGFAAIGIPGANAWKHHYARLLDGFENVIAWGDPDDAGKKFNEDIMRSVRRAVPARLSGDINDIYNTDDGFVAITTAFQRAGGQL